VKSKEGAEAVAAAEAVALNEATEGKKQQQDTRSQ